MLATLLTQYNPDGSVVPSSQYAVSSGSFGRQPFVFVEIDLDFCANVYGSAPCTASVGVTGEQRCFNTFATCQDQPNFALTTKTYRFCSTNGGRVPAGLDAIPCLDSMSDTPAAIDIKTGLGLRAAVSVTLTDFPHSDIRIDPYVSERGYIPLAQGSFFGRLRARNPYYNGRVMRVYTGYLNDDGSYSADQFERRTYFIESWDGISANGKVKISAKDVLKLASDDRAVFPKPSVGKLTTDISTVATTATITPAGVGNLDYPAEGYVRIGSEVIKFTRTGDVLTLTDRAEGGTDAASHKAGDTVQLVGWIDGEKVQDIVYTLMTTGAGISPSYLDKSGWDAEQAGYLPRRYSALITAPTGVSKLISELCEQVGFFLFWDEYAELVRFRAIRPNAGSDPITELTNDGHLLADSVSLKELNDERVNQVHVFYGVIDTTKNLSDETNYKVVHIGANVADQSQPQSRDVRIKTILSRWIAETNGAAAIEVADRYLKRFASAPREADFVVDAKDSALGMADFVRITNRQVQDIYGVPQSLLLQVIKRKEAMIGTKFAFTAREFAYAVEPPDSTRRINIDADVSNINLRTLHDSLFDDPTDGNIVLVTINFDVLVYGDDDEPEYEGYALTTGDWPSGVTLQVVNNGYIVGAGGRGGDIVLNLTNGQSGDDGMTASYPITVENNGTIAGGGGGGGARDGYRSGIGDLGLRFDGGGGGAPYGLGGRGRTPNGGAGGLGQNGGRLTGGAGFGAAGAGGNIGLNGVSSSRYAGGLAGRAIVDPDGYITLTGSGQILGS